MEEGIPIHPAKELTTTPINATAAPSAPAVACQNFDMAADDDGSDDGASPYGSPGNTFDLRSEGGGLGGLTAPPMAQPAPPVGAGVGKAAEVRERLRFLCAEDQKTVCKRECQLALKREEALCRLAQQTVEHYSHALDVGRAVASGKEGEAPCEGQALAPQLVEAYEARMRLLLETVAKLQTEPTVSLPQLSALEKAKGFAFTSYAQTARAMSKLKDNTAEAFKDGSGASATGPPPVLSGARAAWGSLTSKFRNRAGSGSSAGGTLGVPGGAEGESSSAAQ